MAQSLWYLRRNGRVLGPFPTPQVNEFLSAGEVSPDWEVSLNEADWLTIAETGQFAGTDAGAEVPADAETPAWRLERKKARERWLGHDDPVVAALDHDAAADARARRAVGRDHLRTVALLKLEKSKRVGFLPFLTGLLGLLLVGLGIWWGQRESPIQTGIGAAAVCTQPPADGINWTRCSKQGLKHTGLRARNARMTQIRLDDAQLPGADLAYSFLTGASLRNVQFSGASLVGVEFTGADLSGADLSHADLRYAVLKGARLAGTRLTDARLDKATWVDGRICAEGSLGACR